MDLTSAVTAYRSFKLSSHFPPKYSHLIPQILSYSTEITPDSLHEVFHDLNNSQTWENVAFSLLLAIHILNSSNYLDYQSELIITLNDNMMNYLEHEESRVRQLACRLIGVLVQRNGYKEYNILYESVISCVRRNSERECHTRPVILGEEKELALDEVTGWRALETSYNAFKELVKSLRHYVLTCESSDEPFLQTWRRSRVAPIGAEALQIFILDAGVHINRYVRQSCCELVDIMCQLPSTRSPYHRDQVIGDGMPRERSSIFTEYPSPSVVIALRNVLAIGLQDSWCQVRLAATFATNSLLSTISGESNLENLIWPLILPRICLNRHYSTDSVKEVAQDTWIKRLGTRGRELLSTYMSDVVPYYVSMTRHKNHIVCEAACASIAELGSN